MAKSQTKSEPPQSLEAEVQVLGAILLDPELLPIVAKTVLPLHFYSKQNGLIYSTMLRLAEMGTHVSAVTIVDQLRQQDKLEQAGGILYMGELQTSCATTAGTDHYTNLILDRYLQRSIVKFGEQLVELGPTSDNPHEFLRLAGDALAKMNGSTGGGDRRLIHGAILGSQLYLKNVKKPESVVGEGIMTESSFILLYGRPGLGKTWLALQLALAVSQGKPWLGLETKRRGVGVVELEMHEYYLKDRIMELTKSMEKGEALQALGNIEFICRPNFSGPVDLLEPATRDGIISWVQEHGVGLLILDALSRVHTADENYAQEMGKVLAAIERIRDETGCCILVLHHEPKGDTREKNPISDLDAARGSSRLQSDPHTMIRLKMWKGGLVLTFPKMNLGPQHEDIYLERGQEGYVVRSAPLDSETRKEMSLAKIEDALLNAGPEGTNLHALAESSGVTIRTIKARLGEMKVLQPTKGLYIHPSFSPTQMPLMGES